MSHRHLLAAGFIALLGPVLPLRAQLRGDIDTQSLREPAVGDCTLRILTPSLLEVTRISAEAKGQPSATLTVMVNGRQGDVSATGAKRRVAYAPLAHRDLRIATSYYLKLARPIDGSVGRIAVSVSGTTAGGEAMQASTTFDPMRASPAVHVNEEGYAPGLPKKAMVGYYLGDMGEMEIPTEKGFAVVDARRGTRVFEGALVRRTDVGYKTRPAPYGEVYEADFSPLSEPGEYRLLVPGLGTSIPFVINDGIPMGFARTYALGLYEQRCGTSLDLPFTRFVHGVCHDAPAEVPITSDSRFSFTWATIARYAAEANTDEPAQTAPVMDGPSNQLYPFVNPGPVDVSGGHHDAGDYSRYTINSAALVHYLVFTVDSIPGAGKLDNLGIPESGDGVSDILQEAKWEADYLSKLQDRDGGFYFLVYPRDREYESNVTPDHGDPQVVWPKNTSATAAAVAALAQCASSPEFKRHYPGEAEKFLRQARLGWTFLIKAIGHYGQSGAYQKITFYGDHFRDRDELAWAACELYLATGEKEFQDRLFEWFPNPADPATFRWGWWRMSESWGNAIRSYAFAARSGRLPPSALEPRYLQQCEGQILTAGDDTLDWSAKNAYATPFPPATKAVNGGGWYFSMDQASDMAVAYVIDPKPEYIDALVGAMNYEGGCNPVNVAYLTGLGVHRQREIVDQFAQNDGRSLPPSGIPLGNIQAAFQYLPDYGFDLRNASYPDDNAPSSPYPFYDRWSDAYNVTTEFIAVNQARSLMVAALLAGQSGGGQKPWTPVRARIVVPAHAVRAGEPVTLSIQVPGEDLALARVTWEVRGMDPAFGPTYTFSPRLNGRPWVEVEAEWPDGRRAFGADAVTVSGGTSAWIRGAAPTGAVLHSSGGDAWTWKTADPSSRSGSPVHESGLSSGLHEHWFTGTSEPLSVGAGDILYAWVYLDPAHPPSEIMLAWNDGASWEHRAYWGGNSITYGRDGSEGRHYAGPLPAAGKWIRLQVRASAVGLEGSTVNGMGFSLVDGKASWDESGSSR